jgi:hypothetical protein
VKRISTPDLLAAAGVLYVLIAVWVDSVVNEVDPAKSIMSESDFQKSAGPPPWVREPVDSWPPAPIIQGTTFRGVYKGIVLPEGAARSVMRQCSRATPDLDPGVKFWTPTAREIDELEQALAVHVRSGPHGEEIRLATEARQYLGLLRHGFQRTIYVNLFPEEIEEPWRAGAAERNDRWRTGVVVVCDGGSDFFGVEYDLTTHRFTHIAFNGYA